MPNKHMKIFSTSVVIREKPIKNHNDMPIRMVELKSIDNTKCR